MSVPLFNKANLTDKSLDLANFNRIVDYVGRLAKMSSPNMTIDQAPTGYVLKMKPGSTSSMDYSKFAFGYGALTDRFLSGRNDTVDVNAGYLYHGTRTPIRAPVSGTYTSLRVTADHLWIYVNYVIGSGAASIESKLTMPIISATTIEWPLHEWRLDSEGNVSIGTIYHLGNIFVPGTFA
jgi:hypothetical protein